MNENESVTNEQLIILRRLADNDESLNLDTDSSISNIRQQLLKKGLIQERTSEKGSTMISNKALEMMGRADIMKQHPNESRAEEVIRLFKRIEENQEIIEKIEELETKSDLSDSEKLQRIFGIIRNSKIKPTF